MDYNIKPILGIIPNNEDDELLAFPEKKNFWEKVKQWQSFGWEISIHGYNHKYSSVTEKKDYFNYGGRSEFWIFPRRSNIKSKKKY